MKLGFIGFGEAASAIASGLGEDGLKEIKAFDAMANDATMGKLVHKRAEATNVELVDSAKDLVESVDIIMTVVPPVLSLGVCEGIVEFLKPGQIYVDVTAALPDNKIKMADMVQAQGALYADVAMLGAVPKNKHKVPITASGLGAAKYKEIMEPYGMKITLAGDTPGSAAAIKLVRSVFMKGIATLMLEMLEAANAYGVTDEVVTSIGKSMDNTAFTDHLNHFIIGSAIHCKRRSGELAGSIDLLEAKNLGSEMTKATKSKLDKLIDYNFMAQFVEKKPADYKEMIAILSKVR